MIGSRYLALSLVLVIGFALCACDNASPEDTTEDPPRLPPLVEYRVNGYGEFPANHADIIWYTDAVGDTVKIGFHTLQWSTFFRLDTLNHSREAGLYLYSLVAAPARQVGLKLGIYIDGVLVREVYQDGFDSAAFGSNRLFAEEGLPFP